MMISSFIPILHIHACIEHVPSETGLFENDLILSITKQVFPHHHNYY